MLDQDQLAEIAYALGTGAPIPFMKEEVHAIIMNTKLYSKGRPQFNSKTGHAFTPENTRKYEKLIASHLRGCNEPMVFHPIRVVLELRDAIRQNTTAIDDVLMLNDLVYSSVGDVDNRAKAILDAANGILYNDDSQIVDLHVKRRYGHTEGFMLTTYRAGLSKAEANNIIAVM